MSFHEDLPSNISGAKGPDTNDSTAGPDINDSDISDSTVVQEVKYSCEGGPVFAGGPDIKDVFAGVPDVKDVFAVGT
jgi:hypothetical protein